MDDAETTRARLPISSNAFLASALDRINAGLDLSTIPVIRIEPLGNSGLVVSGRSNEHVGNSQVYGEIGEPAHQDFGCATQVGPHQLDEHINGKDGGHLATAVPEQSSTLYR